MYQYPVILPTVSNREDFILTVAINDDSTGEPIKLDGCTTAVPGQPFTGSSWTVANGIQSVPSTSILTIPTFPIVGAAQASLFLFVPTNVAFSQGDPVTITDVNPANSMSGRILSYMPSTGALVVQIGMTFLFEARRGGPKPDLWGIGYSSYPDIGSIPDYGPLLSAQLGTGVAVVDIGYIQIIQPVALFQKLLGGTYVVGLIMSDSVNTRQIFSGTMPVIQGHVSHSPLAPVVGPLWT